MTDHIKIDLTDSIIECGASIPNFGYNLCFFLSLYRGLGNNLNNINNKISFCKYCRDILGDEYTPNELIDNLKHYKGITKLANNLKICIKIYSTIESNPNVINGHLHIFGLISNKSINIIYSRNHYRLLSKDPDIKILNNEGLININDILYDSPAKVNNELKNDKFKETITKQLNEVFDKQIQNKMKQDEILTIYNKQAMIKRDEIIARELEKQAKIKHDEIVARELEKQAKIKHDEIVARELEKQAKIKHDEIVARELEKQAMIKRDEIIARELEKQAMIKHDEIIAIELEKQAKIKHDEIVARELEKQAMIKRDEIIAREFNKLLNIQITINKTEKYEEDRIKQIIASQLNEEKKYKTLEYGY
jgi:hypothetical protein